MRGAQELPKLSPGAHWMRSGTPTLHQPSAVSKQPTFGWFEATNPTCSCIAARSLCLVAALAWSSQLVQLAQPAGPIGQLAGPARPARVASRSSRTGQLDWPARLAGLAGQTSWLASWSGWPVELASLAGQPAGLAGQLDRPVRPAGPGFPPWAPHGTSETLVGRVEHWI